MDIAYKLYLISTQQVCKDVKEIKDYITKGNTDFNMLNLNPFTF